MSTQGIYYTTLGGAPKVCGYVRVCNTLPYFGMADELTKLALRLEELALRPRNLSVRGKGCELTREGRHAACPFLVGLSTDTSEMMFSSGW